MVIRPSCDPNTGIRLDRAMTVTTFSFERLRPSDNVHQFLRNRGLSRLVVEQGGFLD
jgi:hypothetical protein